MKRTGKRDYSLKEYLEVSRSKVELFRTQSSKVLKSAAEATVTSFQQGVQAKQK